MLLLDDSSPAALVVDTRAPAVERRLHEVLVEAWPRLAGRVEFVTAALDDADIGDDRGSDVVVSSHACGRADRSRDRARRGGAGSRGGAPLLSRPARPATPAISRDGSTARWRST